MQDRVYDLRPGSMAEAFSAELARSGDAVPSLAKRFGLVVECQWTAREEVRLSRSLKAAQPKLEASVEEIDFCAPRGLDHAAFPVLAELYFLRHAGNVILSGATGLGNPSRRAPRPLLDDSLLCS